MSSGALLDVKALEVAYGASEVVSGIDLQLQAGEVATLLGRNGMGKSTVIRAVLGLTPARRGTIRLRGERIDRLRTDQIARQGVALVPEGRQIFPNLSVRENLSAFARAHSSRGWTLQRVYHFFPSLARDAGRMGNQLSGGEQQMLAIGRALMTNPDLLILDEATEGLAPLVRQDIWATIRRLRSSGVAVLVVDKDIETLATVADRCVVIAKGRIVYSGTPAALAAEREIMIRHLSV